MTKDRSMDRHNDKWHTQVRNIPPDVWQRVRSAAIARGMNIGEYLTQCILIAEEARNLVDDAVETDEFYRVLVNHMNELNMGVVRA